MKFIRTLALTLILAFAGGAAAQAQTIDHWEISQDTDNCSAMSSFDEGTIAYIGYFPKRGTLSVVILDDKVFASVEDGVDFDAGLTFVDNATNKRADTRWASLPVTGTVLSGGMHGVMLDGPTEALLDSFASQEYFALVQNGEVLVSLKMERGPEVIAALRACMAKL